MSFYIEFVLPDQTPFKETALPHVPREGEYVDLDKERYRVRGLVWKIAMQGPPDFVQVCLERL